jgi:dienelactone hydrolase
MTARWARSAVVVLVIVEATVACGGGSASVSPIATAPTLSGFTLEGNPKGTNGATWTYRATVGGVGYDLQGVLYKPSGAGPFPAIVISHGNGGSANVYSRGIARTMVGWGLVAIATNYTHAAGVPIGAPGTADEPGASPANILRARKLVDILASLGYVDIRRVAAHGHSMGAFVTAATVGTHPDAFLVASHTAGGARPNSPTPGAAPTDAQVSGIRIPYQMHHGESDAVVVLALDQRLASILSARGVTNQLVVYPGLAHNDVSSNPAVLERLRAWYTAHGLF